MQNQCFAGNSPANSRQNLRAFQATGLAHKTTGFHPQSDHPQQASNHNQTPAYSQGWHLDQPAQTPPRPNHGLIPSRPCHTLTSQTLAGEKMRHSHQSSPAHRAPTAACYALSKNRHPSPPEPPTSSRPRHQPTVQWHQYVVSSQLSLKHVRTHGAHPHALQPPKVLATYQSNCNSKG